MLKSGTSLDLADALTRVSSLRDACLWHSMLEFSTDKRLGSPPPDADGNFRAGASGGKKGPTEPGPHLKQKRGIAQAIPDLSKVRTRD